MRSDGTVVDRLDLEDGRLLASCGHGRLLPTEDGGLVLLLDEPSEDEEMTMTIATREEWLTDLTGFLRLRFENAGHPLPRQLRLSCGWPKPGGGGMRHQQLLGTTWFSGLDGVAQIFVSPALIDPVSVGTTLVHELVHVVAGQDAKHGPAFQVVAGAVGLEKPWISTPPSTRLSADLLELATALGQYPHAELPEPTPKRGEPSVKLTCRDCNYAVRVTAAMLDNGKPLCPFGDELEP
jgi:hypothetical protein